MEAIHHVGFQKSLALGSPWAAHFRTLGQTLDLKSYILCEQHCPSNMAAHICDYVTMGIRRDFRGCPGAHPGHVGL